MTKEFTPRKKLPHNVPAWVKPGATYFITMKAEDRTNTKWHCDGRAKQIFDAALFYHQNGKWHIYAFTVMDDHLHALLSFDPVKSYKETCRGYKRYLAKEAKVIWQDDVFEHRVRNDKEHQKYYNYIYRNPVEAGLIADPEDWLYFLNADRLEKAR